MKRKRVDWEKELQKTEAIRMRGFRFSALGFAFAVLFILGASRLNTDAPMFSYVMMIGGFFAAIAILVFTLKRRASKLEKMREEENKGSE